MKITLSESKLLPLMLHETINEYNISDGNANHNPYKKKVDAAINSTKKFIQYNGQLMQDISNGKQYMVYEIMAFANITGKRFGVCQLIKDNEPYGSLLFKPMATFKPIYM